MNRRHFLKSIPAIAAGLTVAPGAGVAKAIEPEPKLMLRVQIDWSNGLHSYGRWVWEGETSEFTPAVQKEVQAATDRARRNCTDIEARCRSYLKIGDKEHDL